MPGREVLTALRSDPSTSRIPVVVVTSNDSEGVNGAVRTLALDVISKGELSRERALSALDRALAHAKAPGRATHHRVDHAIGAAG